MQQDPDSIQIQGVAIRTETGYQVMEGKGALVNRNSLLFAVGQGISLLGDAFYLSTLTIWITAINLAGARTPAQQAAATATIAATQAGIFGAFYLANVLIVPFVGVFVDRWNRRTTMIISDIVQAAFALLPLGAFMVAKNAFIPALYGSYFLLIATQGFFMGSQSGVLQVIVARKNLPQAVSILTILLGAGSVVGALYAPSFFLSVGPVIAITFNAVSFLVSAAALLFLRVPKEALHPYAYRLNDTPAVPAGVGKSLLGVLKDLLHGLRFVMITSVLLGVAIMLIVVQIGAAALNSVTSSFFFANLHANPVTDFKLLGLLPASVGLGYIIGAILVGICAKFIPLKAIIVASGFCLGLGWILFALQTTLINGVTFYAFAGIFNGSFVVSYTALVLKVTPGTVIGRVEGVLMPLASFSSFLSTLVIGGVVKAFNPAQNPQTPFPNPALLFSDSIIIGGVVVILASIVGLFLVRKAKEEIARQEKLTANSAIVLAGEQPLSAGETGS